MDTIPGPIMASTTSLVSPPSSSSSSSSSSSPPKRQPFFLPHRNPPPTSLNLPTSSSHTSTLPVDSNTAPPPVDDTFPPDELTQWKTDADLDPTDDSDDPLPSDSHPLPPPPLPLPSLRTSSSSPSPPFLRPVQTCPMANVFRDDIFASIFAFFDGHSVALLSCVSSAWNVLLQDPMIWQHSAYHYWGDLRHSMSLLPRYDHSWKRMIIERPHPRFDGIYVLETKYWKPGAGMHHCTPTPPQHFSHINGQGQRACVGRGRRRRLTHLTLCLVSPVFQSALVRSCSASSNVRITATSISYPMAGCTTPSSISLLPCPRQYPSIIVICVRASTSSVKEAITCTSRSPSFTRRSTSSCR